MAGYSTKEVADLVDLPRQTIWELARAGVLDPEKTIQIGIRGNSEFLWEFSDRIF